MYSSKHYALMEIMSKICKNAMYRDENASFTHRKILTIECGKKILGRMLTAVGKHNGQI